MTQYCSVGVKSKIYYKFADKKDVYLVQNNPVNIDTVNSTQNNNTNELIKYGREVTIPQGMGTVEVYLYGIAYTAPNYPNCPSAYTETKIGEATTGTVLKIESEFYPNACTNAFFQHIPAIGYTNKVTQWNGDTAKLALKTKSSVCSIKIIDAKNTEFTIEGKCPITYEVVCGDECPEGYCKCASTNYPGYCCLPCSEVKSGLLAIARNIL